MIALLVRVRKTFDRVNVEYVAYRNIFVCCWFYWFCADSSKMAESNEAIPKHMIFDGKNFDNWLFRIEALLDAKNYKRFITGKLVDLVAGVEKAEDKEKLKSAEKVCKSLLIRYVDDSQLEYIKEAETAKEIIDALKKVFQRKSVAGQLILRKRLLTMKYDGGDIHQHFLTFDKTVRELKSIGATLEEIDVVCHLLLTLPESYDALVTALETLDPDKLTLDFVKTRLIDEFGKRKAADGNNDDATGSTAMQAGGINKKCFRCGKIGHFRKTCRVNLNKKSQHSKSGANSATNECETLCAFEEIKTNMLDELFIHELSHDDGAVCLNARAKHAATACTQQIKFILDSGSTDHLVNDKRYFSKLSKMENLIKISVAKDGASLYAKECGEIGVIVYHNGKSSLKTIKEVLFIENLKCNLLSIRKLVEKGYVIKFEEEIAHISLGDEVQFVAKRNGNLYEVEFHVRQNIFAGIANESNLGKLSRNLWHFRLAHLNAADMKTMTTRKMVDGLDKIDVGTNDDFCESCVKGKQTRLPFNKVNVKRSSRILELVHTDICGPMSEKAWNGARFFISFTDDYSRATQIYCIKQKSDALEVFKEYVAMAEARHGVKIARLNADNGGEYSSNEFKSFCKKKGIELSYTVPHNPEMNSIAERVNRTIVEKARTMILASELPRKYWNEAVLAANFIKNRCITSAFGKQFENKTPAEIWYERKPDVSKFRIFGSVCYNHVPAASRKKLDAKAVKCIMLGYESSSAYRLLNTENNKVIVGRNVTFNEREIFARLNGRETIFVPSDDTDEMIDEIPNTSDTSLLDNSAEAESTGNIEESVHNTKSDGVGNIEEIIHSANTDGAGCSKDINNGAELDCTGNSKDNVNSVEATKDDTGNNTGTRKPRMRRPTRFYGVDDEDGVAHFALSAQCFVDNDPISLRDARERSDWLQWKNAVESEYASLIHNKTWVLCKLPPNRKTISCKWVFKLKRKANGDIEKYKARLVARGFTQEKGFDFNETYSPTARLTTFRVLMSMANHFGYFVHQMDVKCAFLNGSIQEEIYMEQPEGFVKDNSLVCKLERSLYGLKQASRMWNERFHGFMLTIGFKRCESDNCLYTKFDGKTVAFVLLYVDDLCLISNSMERMNDIKSALSAEFEMTDIGPIDTFLGMHVQRNERTGTLSMGQTQYMKNVLKKFDMESCKTASTPMEVGLSLEKSENGKCDKPYRELIGCLTYATTATRPDLCAATGYFGQFQNSYSDEHFGYAKHILRYVRGTLDLKLKYQRDPLAKVLVGYADADWAGDKNDRKSVSGYVFKVFGNVVSWSSRKQSTVSLSSTEAEYVSLAQGACEAIWLRNLLHDLGIDCNGPVTIFEDNTSCIKIAEAPRDHRKMKHVDVKYNFIRDEIVAKTIKVEYLQSSEQTADIMTKPLGKTAFQKHRGNLNLI